jgi:hypothetical protein
MLHLLLRRSRAAATAERWDEAARDQLRVTQLDPAPRKHWLRGAGWILLANEARTFSTYRHDMLIRFGATSDVAEAEQLALACLLGAVPRGEQDVARNVARLVKVVRSSPSPRHGCGAELLDALSHYRGERWDAARAALDAAASHPAWPLDPQANRLARLLRAMIAHQSGVDPADEALPATLAALRDELPPPASHAESPYWQACRVLLREADTLAAR